jgi:formate/nitrite transporter FocA (FNT family)
MPSGKKNKDSSKEQKPQKSQKQILQHTEETALTQLNRTKMGLLLSGLSAGLDIGFSVLLMAVVLSLFKNIFPDPVVEFITGNMNPVGFIFVILGRSELFTEHTTLAVLPVLQKLAGIKKLLRLWFYVYISNIVGGIIFSFILGYFAGTTHVLQGWALEEIGRKLLSVSWQQALLSAVLAGWLMGLLAWLIAASRETISQLFIIWLITAAIGIAGLHHCIVGNVEIFAGMIEGYFSFTDYIRFLSLATLGNIIGGVFFVAILKYSHTAFSGKEEEIDIDEPGNE